MGKAVDALMRALEYAIAAALAVMVVLVFANVVARYVFSSGIAVSEELSRFSFVWLVFLGAVVAMREHAHLGVDSLVRRLPRAGRRLCLVLSHVLMLWACAVLLMGSWNHFLLGRGNHAPVTGIALSWVTAAGLVGSAAIGLILVADLVRLALGRLGDDELVQVAEEQG